MPSNVAEGWARRSTLVYINQVDIAIESHAELETCAEAARRLKYVSDDECGRYMVPLARAGQLLNGLLRSLEAKKRRTVKPSVPRRAPSPEPLLNVFEASRECRARIP